MSRTLNIKESTKRLNEITNRIKDCSFSELKKMFSENQINYYVHLMNYCIKCGYIVRDNQKYTWVKTEPMYYKEYEQIVKQSKEKYEVKVITEESAIAFLKEKGYKIMKPIVEYTEI